LLIILKQHSFENWGISLVYSSYSWWIFSHGTLLDRPIARERKYFMYYKLQHQISDPIWQDIIAESCCNWQLFVSVLCASVADQADVWLNCVSKFKISRKRKVYDKFLTWSEVTSAWGEVTFVWCEVTSIMGRNNFWLGRSDWGRNDRGAKWPDTVLIRVPHLFALDYSKRYILNWLSGFWQCKIKHSCT